jgi:hypothetical protein
MLTECNRSQFEIPCADSRLGGRAMAPPKFTRRRTLLPTLLLAHFTLPPPSMLAPSRYRGRGTRSSRGGREDEASRIARAVESHWQPRELHQRWEEECREGQDRRVSLQTSDRKGQVVACPSVSRRTRPCASRSSSSHAIADQSLAGATILRGSRLLYPPLPRIALPLPPIDLCEPHQGGDHRCVPSH